MSRREPLAVAIARIEERDYQHNHYVTHKARYRQLSKAYYEAHKEQANLNRRKNALKSLFGLSLEEYEDMILLQGNKCKICKKPFGKKKGDRPRVDHDHKTGKVRGLLCVQCNTCLGMSGDNATRLRLGAEYLEATDL